MADIRVRGGQQNATKVVSSLGGTKTATLAELNDVDISSAQNGMVLVYNSTISKWEATLELTPGITQNLDVNGGSW